jgi:hypothetical protein
MWAIAASVSDKYIQYEDVLYERARKYAEQAEMKECKDPTDQFTTSNFD